MLDRLIAGDDNALSAIYDSYAPLVYGLAKSVSGDELTAREVTGEVFCYLWEFPDRVDLSRGSLKAYLGMIAHRRAVDAVRRSERRRQAEDRFRATAEQQAPSGEAEALQHSTVRWRKRAAGRPRQCAPCRAA